VFTASSSLANAPIYNSLCPATTSTTASTSSVFDDSPSLVGQQSYVSGSTGSSTSRNMTTAGVDSRAPVLADSAAAGGGVYRPAVMPSGSLSGHAAASLSSGQVLLVVNAIYLLFPFTYSTAGTDATDSDLV